MSKFEQSVIVNSWLKKFIPLAFCSRNYWSQLNNHLMANIWEKAISILAEDLNLGRSYLIITVLIGTRNLRFYETRNLAHFEFSRNMKGLISGILEISQKFLTSQNLEKKRNFWKIPMNRRNDTNFTQMKKSRRNDISFER